MPMVSSKLEKPPDNETVLTKKGQILIFAAYHLGKWFEVPNGAEMSEPDEWLQANDLPVPAQAEPQTIPHERQAKDVNPERECATDWKSVKTETDSRGGQAFFEFINETNDDTRQAKD